MQQIPAALRSHVHPADAAVLFCGPVGLLGCCFSTGVIKLDNLIIPFVWGRWKDSRMDLIAFLAPVKEKKPKRQRTNPGSLWEAVQRIRDGSEPMLQSMKQCRFPVMPIVVSVSHGSLRRLRAALS